MRQVPKVTPKNYNKIHRNLMKFLKDCNCMDKYCEIFDEFLDSLLNEDFFGTEGQCDPRGDRRD